MGENNAERPLFYINGNCKWEVVAPLASVNTFANDGLFIEGDQQKEYITPSWNIPLQLSFRGKFSPCRSRKRFIKLLMAEGTSRNDAQKAAELVRQKGYSYSVGLFWWIIAKTIP